MAFYIRVYGCIVFLEDKAITKPPEKEEPYYADKCGEVVMNEQAEDTAYIIEPETDEDHPKNIDEKGTEDADEDGLDFGGKGEAAIESGKKGDKEKQKGLPAEAIPLHFKGYVFFAFEKIKGGSFTRMAGKRFDAE